MSASDLRPASSSGTASPWVSSCSTANHAAAASAASPRRAITGRIRSSPSGPANTASAGRGRTSGATGVPSGTYGGLHSDQVDVCRPGRPAASGTRTSRRDARLAAGRVPAALRRAQASAAGRRSTASTRASGGPRRRWRARARPSRRTGRPPAATSPSRERRRSTASTSSSVSGRGDEHPGPDRERRRGGTARCRVMCCSGSRAARRAISVRGTSRDPSSTAGGISSRARGTPSTCGGQQFGVDARDRDARPRPAVASARAGPPAATRGRSGARHEAASRSRALGAAAQRGDHVVERRRRGPGPGCRPCSRPGGR